MDESPGGEKIKVAVPSRGSADAALECPRCRAVLNPADHGNLIFDGQVWCDKCQAYDRELIRPREFNEMQSWSRLICTARGFPPVPLEINDDPALYRLESAVLMAEANHRQGSIRLYAPGCRLVTLCHELAHIFTGQDHTPGWARIFASLVAWVKSRLDSGKGVEGYQARQSIYDGVPQRVY